MPMPQNLDSPSQTKVAQQDGKSQEAAPYMWLKKKDFRDQELRDQNNTQAHVDVVHVAALCPEENMHSFEDLIPSIKTERREFIFQFEVASLLIGDLTQQSLEQQATRLLSGLTALQKLDKGERRAIIFVAYDLGALVVKTALSLAVSFQNEYYEVFNNAAQFIFSGCLQRAANQQILELKLFELLFDTVKDQIHLNSRTIHYLAKSITQSSEMFISSKISLRSRIISLYANDTNPNTIHGAHDYLTATLGIPPEVIVQEQPAGSSGKRFPSLSELVSYRSDHWIPHKGWTQMEKSLLACSSPHYQFKKHTSPPSTSHPILIDPIYTDWCEFAGPRILYIQGDSYDVTHEMTDQVVCTWQRQRQDKDIYYATTLSFSFDSTDPSRNSIPDMIASFLVQALFGHKTGSLNSDFRLLEDRFNFNGGWTEKSCINIFDSMRAYNIGPDTLLLLHDFDECNKDSRAQFLDYVKKLSEASEKPLKILITSRKPNVLLTELQHWPKINSYNLNYDPAANLDHTLKLLAHTGIQDARRDAITENLSRLSEMDKDALQISLKLIQDHTGWPKDLSTESLTKFTQILGWVSPNDAPEIVLDKVLRSNSNIEGFTWALSWLLCGYRPLSQGEFIDIMFKRPSQQVTDIIARDSPSSTAEEEMLCQLKTWLRLVADFSYSQITIQSGVRDLLKEDTETHIFMWNEVKRSAHRIIAEFCLEHLSLSQTQDILRTIYQQSESQHSSGIQPPIVPNGRSITFYVVQSLPYHLCKCLEKDGSDKLWSRLIDPDNRSLLLWAKAYWGMSNPFSRPLRVALQSPLSILVSLGMLTYEDIKNGPENSHAECFIMAAGSGRYTIVTKFLEESGNLPISVLFDALPAAIQGKNENIALEIAQMIISSSEKELKPSIWEESTIWAAIWLNMDKLLEIMLKSGASIELSATKSYPSPLFMASSYGHSSICRALLLRGADKDLQQGGGPTALNTAVRNGHSNILREFINQDLAYVKGKQPNELLNGASLEGNFAIANALLDLGIDPNILAPNDLFRDDYECAALPLACARNNPKTTRVLLERNADPNIRWPDYNSFTPLWFASMWGPHPQCVQHLIEHGADPNDKHLYKHLLLQIASEKKDEKEMIDVCTTLNSGKFPIQLDHCDSNGQTALMIAVRNENLQFVQWLLKNGADVNALDKTKHSALHLAIKMPNRAIIQEILAQQPKFDVIDGASTETLLQTALHAPEILDMLLAVGADPERANTSGDTLINSAVLSLKSNVVSLLIKKKVDIHHRDSSGQTPIWAAVSRVRDASLVGLLAEGGANLADIDADGRTLLHAAIDGPPEIIKILLAFGKYVNPNQRDTKDRTPLMTATLMSNLECINALIKGGADVNARDSAGRSVLHYAVLASNVKLISLLLLEPTIDMNHMDPILGTPLHEACRQANINVVNALLDRSPDIHSAATNSLGCTPLIAGLLPHNNVGRSEKGGMIDQIVRTLTHLGADIKAAVPSSTVYNPIMAACLGATTSTINFLLDEGASAQLANPISGRIPLHFAAANGIQNFQAVLLAYKGDIMVADHKKKNCLHWAAQFGNAKTVEYILSRLNGKILSHYLEQTDGDGWTPLCWAMRPSKGGYADGMKSEKTDYTSVVRILLHHGARPDVIFRYGGAAAEMTPLELAQRCDANADVIGMLNRSIEERKQSIGKDQSTTVDGSPMRKYSKHTQFCSFCVTVSLISQNSVAGELTKLS